MRKFLSEQSGRSMIEMLGVLAIIGVLSVGGIAGYSKAMAKYKQNKLGDQVSMLITNIRTLYGNNPSFAGLDTTATLQMGAVDKEMYVAPTTDAQYASKGIKNVYNDTPSVHIKAAADGNSFIMTIDHLPSTACTYIAAADWGSSIGSGWEGVGVKNTNLGEQASLAQAANRALSGGYTSGSTSYPDLPMTVASAALGCSAQTNTNSVMLQFK